MGRKILICSLVAIAFLNGVAQSDFYRNYKGANEKYLEGKYDDVLQISLKALEIAERSGVPVYIAYANTQVGNMYYLLSDRKSAVKWYMNAMGEIEKHNIDSMKSEIYHNTSVMYNEMGIMDSCLKYSNKAIALLREKKMYVELSRALSAVADIYLRQAPDMKKAEEVINEAEYYARLGKNEGMVAYAVGKRASLLANQKKYREAIAVLNTTGAYYRKSTEMESRTYYYASQVEYRKRIGDQDAWKYNDTLTKLKNEVFKKETAEKVAHYETLYKTEKKERENKLLQQENIIKQTQIDSRNRMIIGLIIGILLIGALVAWRISVMNLRKKEKELEASKAMQKEKERISRDLHDNVGGQLSYVLYSVDGLNDQDAEKRLSVTQNINESIRNVISNLRETIWAISDEAITVNDLSDKLKVYARSMFRNKETKIIFNEQLRKDIRLNSSTGLNVYRICQEIINNAFKHSQASELTISIIAEEQLEIKISDNGTGFDTQNAGEGYGIDNMRKRAHETGISFKIESRPGEGTTCKLVV